MSNNYGLQKKKIKKILIDYTISKNEKINKIMSIKFYIKGKTKTYSKKEALKLYNMNKPMIEEYKKKYKKNESKYILINKNNIY